MREQLDGNWEARQSQNTMVFEVFYFKKIHSKLDVKTPNTGLDGYLHTFFFGGLWAEYSLGYRGILSVKGCIETKYTSELYFSWHDY